MEWERRGMNNQMSKSIMINVESIIFRVAELNSDIMQVKDQFSSFILEVGMRRGTRETMEPHSVDRISTNTHLYSEINS